MLLAIGSIIMVVLAAGYSLIMPGRRHGGSTGVSGIGLSTLLAVLSGTAIGILSAQAVDYSKLLAMAIVVPVMAALGYWGGRKYSLRFAAHMVLIGSVSGYAGVIFGIGFFSANRVIFVTDVAFIVLLFIVLRLAEANTRTVRTDRGRVKSSTVNRGAGFILMYGTGLTAMAIAITLWGNSVSVGQIGQPLTQLSEYDTEHDLQIAQVEIGAAGLSPANTDFTKGGMMKINFQVKASAGANLTLTSSDLNVDAPLQTGDNVFLFNNPLPGTYKFAVGDRVCTFTVK
ncbi:hypothetical protein [Cohnella terricola]|uniref:Uncharacterized protein n=1 Tax=Cohnella terricola TaxID=1289167 RepID=A0A559J9D8_9BACL|nr:hypothetical protein [Cohnella terricola]TVX96508.1 hypothetical protein FPZ45_21145 [Cohnella terricola]